MAGSVSESYKSAVIQTAFAQRSIPQIITIRDSADLQDSG
jgi:hypothetical protein